MSCCVHLLDFYHEIGREELYVKYLKKLSTLHEQCHNWAEAGFTIMQVGRKNYLKNSAIHGLFFFIFVFSKMVIEHSGD